MKNKSFLNKLEELKPEVPVHLQVERKLIPRLKFMGYVMSCLCLATFIFALTVHEETEVNATAETLIVSDDIEALTSPLSDDTELELGATEVLNFYAISLVFALVAGSLFLIARKKKKVLYSHAHTKK